MKLNKIAGQIVKVETKPLQPLSEKDLDIRLRILANRLIDIILTDVKGNKLNLND